MNASVEAVSPTRVKLSVEVPFDELKPAMDAAYKRLAGRVKVPGFRPGKVPPKILEQRIGRAAILEEAVSTAIPEAYANAVQENKLPVVSRPEVEISSFADGESLAFTATVDVRPDIVVPDYENLPVVVDSATPADADIDEQLSGLQDRFAMLSAVERPVADGDYVLIDISGAVGGEPLADSDATGLSYLVGSDGMVPGLDAALLGLSAGETRTFDAEVRFGEHTGKTAQFTVTPTAVKEKQVPPLDGDFAQTASEFDTLAELRADIGARLSEVGRVQQAMQARDRAIEALLSRVEVPLPESLVEEEDAYRRARFERQLADAGLDLAAYAERTGRDTEALLAEVRTGAEQAVKSQLVLDALADREELAVTEGDLVEQLVRRAERAGVTPDELAARLSRAGQLENFINEVRRGKALAVVLDHATVTDATGAAVDLSAFMTQPAVGSAATEAAAEHDHDHDHDHDDHEGHDHG